MANRFRPFLNDVSAGAISPKLYGKQNSEIYSRGASALDNMFPDKFGQAARRGALAMIAEITGSSTNCRIIPWKVSDAISLLLVFVDGHVLVFDCSEGHTVGFVSGVDITEIKPGFSVYSGAAIHELNYATGNGSMYLAHRNYPLFSIRMVSYSGSPAAFTFESGAVELEGSIAYTPEIEAANSAQGDFLSTALFCSAMGKIPVVGTAVPVTSGYVNNHPVASIVKNVTASPRRYSLVTWDFFGVQKLKRTNQLDDNNPVMVGAPLDFWIAKSEKSPAEVTGKFGSSYTTNSQLLDKLEQAGIAEKQNAEYFFTYDDIGINPKGTINWERAKSSTSFTVNFSDGTSAITVTPTYPDMIGFIKIDAYGINVNKNTVGGAAALDCVAPWMVPNTAYKCDSSKLFFGIYPVSAEKNESAKKLDDDGVAIADGFNSITVSGYTGAGGTGMWATREVYRNTIVTGQLGVVVNPFAYGAGRYPAFVAFHNGRMVVGGSKDESNVLYLSKVNDFTNFCYFDEIEYEQNTIRPKSTWANPNIPEYDVKKAITQQVGQDSAMRLQLLTDESEALRWAASMGDLVVGTATSEWIIPGGATAHNARAVLMSRNGSSHIQGRFVRGSIMFAQGDGRALKMFENANGEVSSAISDHAEHLFRVGGPLLSFDFRQTPVYSVVAVKTSGDAIYGVIGGGVIGFSPFSTRQGDSIESMAVLSIGDEDALYAVVKRSTPSGDKRFLERLVTMPEDGTPVELAHLDGARYAASTGASGIVAGLGDFFDEPGARIVFGSGAYGAPVILSDGSCAAYIDGDRESPSFGTQVANPADVPFVIGYRYLSRYRTVRIDSPETEGLMKDPGAIMVRTYKSGEWWLVRQRVADISPVFIPRQKDEAGSRIYPYSGSIRVENPSGQGTDQYVEIVTDSHEPLVIQSVVPYYEVGEEV